MSTKNKTNVETTVSCSVEEHEALKTIAGPRGLKIKHSAGLVLEGWHLLSEKQKEQALNRFVARRSRVRA